jgi:carboxypeptidase family protein
MLTPQEHEGTMREVPLNGRNFDQLVQLAPGVAGATSLRGTVTDMSGATVPGARVTVRNEQTGASQTTTSDARGIYQFFNVPMGNSALFVDSPGFKRFDLSNFFIGSGRSNEIDARLEVGSVAETITVQAAPVTLNAETAEVSSVNSAIANQHVEAEGKAMGDYFEYDIKQKIIIGKNQSALVPILEAHIDAEKVSLWSEGSQEIRRALWITNSSGLTLDSGTFNILDADTFAGEGLLDTVHPAERRLISYAADPALRITMDEEGNDKPSTHVRITKGIMVLTHEQRDKRKYTLHNSDTTPRQVVIEHPAREGWKLVEGAKPEETSASFLRFRVGVGPGKTENLEIEEYHPEDIQYELSELDDKQVTLITQQKAVTPALQEVFRKVLAQKNVIGSLETQIKQRQQEVEAITKDQARLRENMKALKGSAEEKALLSRYTHQLDSQEDRLGTLNKEISDLNGKKSQADEQLDQMVQQVTLDENF